MTGGRTRLSPPGAGGAGNCLVAGVGKTKHKQTPQAAGGPEALWYLGFWQQEEVITTVSGEDALPLGETQQSHYRSASAIRRGREEEEDAHTHTHTHTHTHHGAGKRRKTHTHTTEPVLNPCTVRTIVNSQTPHHQPRSLQMGDG